VKSQPWDFSWDSWDSWDYVGTKGLTTIPKAGIGWDSWDFHKEQSQGKIPNPKNPNRLGSLQPVDFK
jgi:hypothetical protein